MASSFDRWEKDPFFNAAEEVQESADRYLSFFQLGFPFVLRLFPILFNLQFVFPRKCRDNIIEYFQVIPFWIKQTHLPNSILPFVFVFFYSQFNSKIEI